MMNTQTAIRHFLDQLSMHGQGLLLLDYDGTVAPFTVDRHKAPPDPGIASIIQSIMQQGSTRLVFVTGRPCRELIEVSGFGPGIEAWGCHGREHLDREGRLSIHGVAGQVAEDLRHAAALTRDAIPDATIEVKTGCLALHWRGFPESRQHELETQARALWAPLHSTGLITKPFNGGLELYAPGRTKGDAVRALLRECDDSTPVAFLGDDLTDEDGFRILKGRGLGVLVADEDRPTEALARVTTPDGVAEFLTAWNQAVTKEVSA